MSLADKQAEMRARQQRKAEKEREVRKHLAQALRLTSPEKQATRLRELARAERGPFSPFKFCEECDEPGMPARGEGTCKKCLRRAKHRQHVAAKRRIESRFETWSWERYRENATMDPEKAARREIEDVYREDVQRKNRESIALKRFGHAKMWH